MAGENSVEETLKNVELFLKQQAELFGDDSYLPEESTQSKPATTSKLPGQGGAEQTAGEEQKEPAEETQLKQKSKTIRIAEDHSLFEGAVLNAGWKIDQGWFDSTSLNELDSRINGCQKCALGTTRKNFVFGVGDAKARLVLIGEAPGADEDEQGEPFVGRAGQLLNKILAAVQFRREEVYICNILKCRPPNNRDPLPGEVEACEPFLKKQLQIIRPKLILCLGRIAGQTLLNTNATLSELRQNVYEYQGVKLLVTFHPAALLRNPNWKRPAWEDIQKVRKMYDELPD